MERRPAAFGLEGWRAKAARLSATGFHLATRFCDMARGGASASPGASFRLSASWPRTHQQVIAMTMEPLPLSPTAGGVAWEPIT
jgi:hypothetical protein